MMVLVTNIQFFLFDVFNLKKASYKGMLNTVHYVQESHFHFDERCLIYLRKKIILCMDFFKLKNILNILKIQSGLISHLKMRLKTYCEPLRKQFKDPISLHIRRGDFLINHKIILH